MEQLAERLDHAADVLTSVDRRIPTLSVAPDAFGATDAGGGLPGRLGRDLYAHWTAVLGARSLEAASAATRLAETARSVRTTRRHYADTDELVRRRFTREI